MGQRCRYLQMKVSKLHWKERSKVWEIDYDFLDHSFDQSRFKTITVALASALLPIILHYLTIQRAYFKIFRKIWKHIQEIKMPTEPPSLFVCDLDILGNEPPTFPHLNPWLNYSWQPLALININVKFFNQKEVNVIVPERIVNRKKN